MQKDWSNPYAVPVKSALSYALLLYNSCEFRCRSIGTEEISQLRTIPSILVRGFCVANFLPVGLKDEKWDRLALWTQYIRAILTH
jgi:hypothetical protein